MNDAAACLITVGQYSPPRQLSALPIDADGGSARCSSCSDQSPPNASTSQSLPARAVAPYQPASNLVLARTPPTVGSRPPATARAFAADRDHDFIQGPFVTRLRPAPADGVGKGLAELEGPLTDGLVADEDAAGREHLFDHAKAERETEIQPDRVADDLGRKAVTGVSVRSEHRHTGRIPAAARQSNRSPT